MFKLKSKYSPSWDQPKAIKSIVNYLKSWKDFSTLWWVTGSWKTFVMANIIEKLQKPTLIIAHNKTLAAQLALEFKEFFPDNAVHYFVSYYDYYQPEAYVQKTDTYIEKEATINEEIDRLRHAATQSLLTRKDVIIVASVSCIYGIWDISLYLEQVFDIEVWKKYILEDILKKLVLMQYKRAHSDFKPWMFLVQGDILEIWSASSETVYTIEFWGDEVSQITSRNYLTWEIYEYHKSIKIFPAKHTVTTKDRINSIIPEIKKELKERLEFFKKNNELLKYERLKTKVEYDIEMMQEVGYINWIENYSRYLDWRKAWEAPTTLIDYFWEDFLCFVDESHMTFSQIWWMYAWDRSRKENLVENGFRLPSALDNRPLKFNEFEEKLKQVIAVSATPSEYEIKKSCKNPKIFFDFDPIKDWKWQDSIDCRVVPQIIRPTGLLDPKIFVKEMEFMVDDIMNSILECQKTNTRMLITTITKRTSEELSDYLFDNWVKVKYLHSEIDTLERLEILKELRQWAIDVIVWVNLLREGLDLPEVSKIAILDADKQWFLRSESSLIQIIWRAARNANWVVDMFVEKYKKRAEKDFSNPKLEKSFIELWDFEKIEIVRIDKWKWITKDWLVISEAMRKAINLNYYRRRLQDEYNKKNNITPKTVLSKIKDIWIPNKKKDYSNIDKENIEKQIKKLELEMDIAASNLDFEKAAELRDEILYLKGKK